MNSTLKKACSLLFLGLGSQVLAFIYHPSPGRGLVLPCSLLGLGIVFLLLATRYFSIGILENEKAGLKISKVQQKKRLLLCAPFGVLIGSAICYFYLGAYQEPWLFLLTLLFVLSVIIVSYLRL